MNEIRIWEFLLSRIGNPFGVAGLMGNLFAESGLNPRNLQNAYENKLGYTDDTYTRAVDNGDYTASSFVHDNAGYGLAQWMYWSRKEKLLDHAKACGASVGDLDVQLEFLWAELQTYTAVLGILKNAKTVREASDAVLTKYERPTDQSDSVKEKRASFGQKYYDLYADNSNINEIDKGGGDDMATNYDKYIKSTGTHYISNSGSDESGAYTGGTAGDQNGKEWQLKAWYNRPWTVVLRYPDQAVALKIAQLSIDAALNNKIGYDQKQRTTYWAQLAKVGYDPSKIAVACEQDCTAGVSSNVRGTGFLLGIKALQTIPICTSRNMKAQFTKAGFIALTASKYLTSGKYLLPGDILLYENHHAAANVTLGKSVREQWNPPTAPQKAIGAAETTAKEIIVKDVKPPFVAISGSVHVRRGPSTDYASMGTLKSGEKVHYFGYTFPDNGWFLVEYNDQTGWVSGKYGTIVG